MNHPWTSVVSYHTDVDHCGTARFSAQLAQRLGVPHVAFNNPLARGDRPLLSVKFSEHYPAPSDLCLDQLWHDEPLPLTRSCVTGRVWKLYEIGVPALVQPVTLQRMPVLFTFGMAHRLDCEKFAALRSGWGKGAELWISTAAHEGAGPSKVPELVRVWGPDAYNLGHLTDAALSLIWPRISAFVAFFEHGLRANNSSVHAALDAGVPVITNHGAQTPDDLRARTSDYRSGALTVRRYHGPSPYTWDRLLRELCAPSTSATA